MRREKNKEMRCRKEINRCIKNEEWKEYFKSLLKEDENRAELESRLQKSRRKKSRERKDEKCKHCSAA